MLPPTVEAFKFQRAQQAAARLKHGQAKPESGKDYVFTGPEGGFVRAKLRSRTMYQTRHTFATNALAAGENPKWVVDVMGHKSTEILFEVYEKYIPKRTRTDGSALVTRMKEESGEKNGSHTAVQCDPNTTVLPGGLKSG